MKESSLPLILLNGEPKTPQIDYIVRVDDAISAVRFIGAKKDYNYKSNRIVRLTSPQWLDPSLCKVYRGFKCLDGIVDIWRFEEQGHVYWRINYEQGKMEEYIDGQISVVKSCLGSDQAKNIFSYLTRVAATNPLGKEENNGILSNIYDRIESIEEETSAACYIDPKTYGIKPLKRDDLIYPFGINESQKLAVERAFAYQISIIQGPPGTGKTQTVLNIIANIVCRGKTVIVVSNNNSAIENIKEKLDKEGLGFLVATLGSGKNKQEFIDRQPTPLLELDEWAHPDGVLHTLRQDVKDAQQKLGRIFDLQSEQARLRQDRQDVELEWKHFCMANEVDEAIKLERRIKASYLLSVWQQYEILAEDTEGLFSRLKSKAKTLWLGWICRYRLNLRCEGKDGDFSALIRELQMLYYLNIRQEISDRLDAIGLELFGNNVDVLMNKLSEQSMTLLKASLNRKYQGEWLRFDDVSELKYQGDSFLSQYPVVLSTTFSARSSMFLRYLYDYVIMDEASQVSIDTGFLALTCARNAVIVGDTLQLPNVISEHDKEHLSGIFEDYDIPVGYDCSCNSFLQSISTIIKGCPETLLREHYRCHPRIINFCNQKFYRGNLSIRTHDSGEPDVLCAYRTVKGNHAVNRCNQREVDVVKHEVLPTLKSFQSIGIVTPYNNQVSLFTEQLPSIETATIHKYQGRERDAIVMSTVDNEITSFADDPNLLNVAVSRARHKFCLVVSGNPQEKHGNIMDLLDYINYNNCTITDSKISSTFDYLYEQYTQQRIEYLSRSPKISKYASENLAYALISDILLSDQRFAPLKIFCHIPLGQIFRDTSLMSPQERKYAMHYMAHVDFLIINRVSKKPVLAIEIDGYSFHHKETDQYDRDQMKNQIFQAYAIPLIRLSTRGSGEEQVIRQALEELDDIVRLGS